MADHYRVLGVSNSATKDEIKHAFRKLAVQFHPDKHALSSKPTRDAATLKFKQVSEAYEVLIDDHKRAAYNISRYSHNTNHNHHYGNHGYGYGNRYDREYYRRGGSFYRPPPPRPSSVDGFALNVEAVLRFMMTRGFLLNLAFAGMLLGGAVAIDTSGEALWKIQNPGKSFEEAMEMIEKNKTRKDKQ